MDPRKCQTSTASPAEPGELPGWLDYAITGVDGSTKMLEMAAGKFPDHRLIHADITKIPESLNSFDAGICFHVLMHLDHKTISQFLASSSTVIRPGGRLIVDLLSAPRRKHSNRKHVGWHGNTSFDIREFTKLAQPYWKLSQWRGIVLIPIHRIPYFLRPFLSELDALLCKSFLARYASYYVIELERIQ